MSDARDSGDAEKYILQNVEPHFREFNSIYAEAAKEMLIPYPSTKLESYPAFNKATGGFRPFEFSILCGQTGVGKTTLLANLSAQLLRGNVPHYVASVETGATDYVKRVISAMSGNDWNTGDPVDLAELKAFHIAHARLMESDLLSLSLYEDRLDVRVLMSDIAWMVKNKGIKIAFIDNLNFFLEVTSAQNSVIEMDRVIHELIIFCKRVNVHVVMVMHPKKTDGGRVENEFDIKGSSTAVQEAHNVLLFNRAGKDLVEGGYCTANDRELKITKMRRRGSAVGSRIILKAYNGVRYLEGPRLAYRT